MPKVVTTSAISPFCTDTIGRSNSMLGRVVVLKVRMASMTSATIGIRGRIDATSVPIVISRSGRQPRANAMVPTGIASATCRHRATVATRWR